MRTYVQELTELRIADQSFLILSEIKFNETTVHVERHPLMEFRLLHHLSELVWSVNTNLVTRCQLINYDLRKGFYAPNATIPFPLVSNSWKAVLYSASGTQSSPSNAWNSANDMSLRGQKKEVSQILFLSQNFHLPSNFLRNETIEHKPIFTGIDDTSEQINGVRIVIWIGVESKVTSDEVRRGHEPLAILLS